jgi:hypothetical protein
LDLGCKPKARVTTFVVARITFVAWKLFSPCSNCFHGGSAILMLLIVFQPLCFLVHYSIFFLHPLFLFKLLSWCYQTTHQIFWWCHGYILKEKKWHQNVNTITWTTFVYLSECLKSKGFAFKDDVAYCDYLRKGMDFNPWFTYSPKLFIFWHYTNISKCE